MMYKDNERYYVDENECIWKMLVLSNNDHHKSLLYVSRINGTDSMQKYIKDDEDVYEITKNYIRKFN